MAHKASTALLAECESPTFQTVEIFKAAQIEYMGALAKMGTQIAYVQGFIDLAEDGESHEGTLQRIGGLGRQAHAVQQHHDKARHYLHDLRESVVQFQVYVEELRNEVTNPTPPPEV